MKLLRVLLLFILLISYFGCQKDNQPLQVYIFGPVTDGIRTSISLSNMHLHQGKSAIATVLIQNTFPDSVKIKGSSFFVLYDSSMHIERHMSYFDITQTEKNNLIKKSKFHPPITLKLAPKAEIKRVIDITRLGWLLPVDSHLATKTFYQVVAKDTYILRFELDLVNGDKIQSNDVRIVVE